MDTHLERVNCVIHFPPLLYLYLYPHLQSPLSSFFPNYLSPLTASLTMSSPRSSSEEVNSLTPFGPARSTITDSPLSPDDLRKTNDYMRACLYLCLGMLYLKENPLLKEPLRREHLKARLLGHWGSDAGQIFVYVHFNRLIRKYGLDAIFVSGPGEWFVLS